MKPASCMSRRVCAGRARAWVAASERALSVGIRARARSSSTSREGMGTAVAATLAMGTSGMQGIEGAAARIYLAHAGATTYSYFLAYVTTHLVRYNGIRLQIAAGNDLGAAFSRPATARKENHMSQERPASPPFGRLLALPNDYEMHYLEHGTGPAVVFVHGSGPGVSAFSNFYANYKTIAAAGYRALLPDMLGFGWSSKPTDIDYTLDLFTSTLGAFLDKLDVRRCVLVGNSLGGAIAIGYALKQPERVAKLVLMGPGGIESRETYFKMPGIQRMVSEFVGQGFDRAGLRRLLEIL